MEIQTLFILTAAFFGFINLSKFLLKILVSLWAAFIRPEKDLRSYGSWVAITGSTDGIGRALAFEIAARGLNLVLIGRNPSKLEATSREIRRKHGGIEVKTVAIDFAAGCRSGEEIARAVEREIKGLDLGILINNAGLAYPYARFMHEVDDGLMESVVGVNAAALTWLTRAAVAGMLERRRGAIVNVGSGSSACLPSYPLYTVYAATKAYVTMLSKSMSLEYKQHGIDVQCQIPLLVATKMSSIKKSSLFIPSAETYSKASLRWIGQNEPICLPYWPHALQAFIISLLPHQFLDTLLFRYFVGMRARGRSKDAKTGHLVDKSSSFKLDSAKLN
ncbi:very-long-chain 3-oxoacyl-CoA reductase 1-like [Salvia miltiorrhiza]|uniref:very-long-chain 3-oxoacyl-CoA reductase 1-like n=1 Tax=Salvia miltiorrhiza TaxID=226208 RepID=UPI0025AC7FD6|nr:very-long-chain 3-oxoacyl-CoA reductase 1-like [Salvia miltiorrhiza]